MTVATLTAPKTTAPTKAQQGMAKADRDAAVATLVAKWNAESLAESGALQTLTDAQTAVDNIRVIKCRIFFNLADTLAYKGEPSLAGATKALHNGKDTKKNSYRPYLQAGTALREAGFNLRTTTPTPEEREIVAKAWNAFLKARKSEDAAKAKAAKAADTESDGGETDGAGADAGDDLALNFSALLAHFARANATADMLISAGTVITEQDLTLLASICDDLQLKLAVHAG